MKIALAQLNFTVGDFAHNTDKIIKVFKENQNADLVVFPELCVCGYPGEDMVARPEFVQKSLDYTNKIIQATKTAKADILINTPWKQNGKIYNAALIVSKGKIIYKQYKYDLPNYGVFDEKRVFEGGTKPKPFKYKGKTIGMLICEDTWSKENASGLKGAEFILSVNASPFERRKHAKRMEIASVASKAGGNIPVLYVNQVCGHDDLVFDGGSFAMAGNGKVFDQMDFFREDVTLYDTDEIIKAKPKHQTIINEPEHMYQAMMLALRDYIHKNGFPGVILGLSGGIDSAISAVASVDALGADKVKLVMLPSKYTSDESVEDAKYLASNLGVKLDFIDIEPLCVAFEKSLKPFFKDTKSGVAEENLQARIRGNVLMALSNKFGHLLLSTGNKSEVAVGYCTLYGDMCGGYNLIKDLYKTRVYEIAKWRNSNLPQETKLKKLNLIPNRIITKAPSAELRPNQKDEDTLPKYEVLDKILYEMVEMDKSVEDIVSEGFNPQTCYDVEKMVHKAEYKRRQSAPGVKISSKPFGRDRRYPITNKFLDY
ncbi:MAG: NAD+ synthase [Rickettsiales bacterium]|nr:NAD+ synthase [Rickettsiales bacterium]